MLCKKKDMESAQNLESAYEMIEKIESETKQIFKSIEKLKV